jgi:hypothetical protein
MIVNEGNGRENGRENMNVNEGNGRETIRSLNITPSVGLIIV